MGKVAPDIHNIQIKTKRKKKKKKEEKNPLTLEFLAGILQRLIDLRTFGCLLLPPADR